MTTVKCNKCGKARSLDKETEAKYVKQFGSKEKMLDGFLCREHRPKKEKPAKKEKVKKQKKVKKE